MSDRSGSGVGAEDITGADLRRSSSDDPGRITDVLYGQGDTSGLAGSASDAAPDSGLPHGGMGETSFVETTHVSWLDKLKGAALGVVLGLVLILGAVAVLFWNEGRAVQTSRSLSEGAGAVIEVESGRIEPSNDGKLVHVQGDVAAADMLVDPDLGVRARAARLVRKVEMFQWKEESRTETVKQVGGGEQRTTTYSYRREWSTERVASERFHRPDGHANPQMRFLGSEVSADDATLGAFRLGRAAVRRLPADRPFPIDGEMVREVRGRLLSGQVQAAPDGTLYLGRDSANPQLGDHRVTYTVAPLGPASFVGQQSGRGLVEFQTKAGDRLLMASPGLVPASAMFSEAEAANRVLTWVVRIVGTIVMFVGFALVLRPIAVLGDVVPVIGTVLGAGTGLAALLLTAVLAPLVVAIAWFVYRPLVSLAILAIGAALVIGLRWLAARRRQAPAMGAPAAAA